jgi:hypothetical protein
VPLLNFTLPFALLLRKSVENLIRVNRVVRLLVAPTWLSSANRLGWPPEQQFTSVTSGVLQSALGRDSESKLSVIASIDDLWRWFPSIYKYPGPSRPVGETGAICSKY